MKSLFLRMRTVHWIGISILVANAFLLTENRWSMAIQLLVALVVLLHDLDEKRWGVDALQQVSLYMENFTRRDLSQPCDVDARFNTEITQVLDVIDNFRTSIRDALKESQQFADHNKGSVHDINRMIREISERIDGITSLVEQAHTDLAQMDQISQDLLENAETSSQQIQMVSDNLNDSQQGIQEFSGKLRLYSEHNQQLSAGIAQLSSNTDQVKGVLTVVGGIAEQTNLLALNAAIEAARAGEQGRGFAVVADEVRGLAVRTQQSLEEIHKIIGDITQSVDDSTQMMESQTGLLDGVLRHMDQVMDKIATATEDANAASEQVIHTASAAGESSQMNAQIVEAVSQVHRHSAANLQAVNEIARRIQQQEGMEESMQLKLAEFQL